MKKEKLRFYGFVGLFFIMAGLLMSSQHLVQYWQRANAQPVFVSTAKPPETKPKQATLSGQPSRVEIPAVGISIEVVPGYYNKSSQTWTLSLNKAHYATITPEPNDSDGNTFIYGHNRKDVFSKLLNIKKGDEAIVTTSNGHKFYYSMKSRHDTSPTDGSLFDYQGPPILTLQTCSGFWYQNRSLFVFDLQKAI
jgi:LPXTG-site transpeptidase (sortase) family protein